MAKLRCIVTLEGGGVRRPPERLTWSARGFGADVYHAWQITGTFSECHVLPEESQYGALARLDHAFRRRRMFEGHQEWLQGLKEVAMGTPRPPS
ncbi:MAG: hypothetical protein WA688_02530 [Thermoplasmata archaeon]